MQPRRSQGSETQRPLPDIPPFMSAEEVSEKLPDILRKVMNWVAQQSTVTERRILEDPRLSDKRVARALSAAENEIALDFNARAEVGSVLTIIQTQEGYQAAFVPGDGSFPDGTAPGPFDHGNLLGLADDDHLQYLLLAGRGSGQTANGGTTAGGDLSLHSTAHGTKGNINLGDDTTYDEVNERLGVNELSPDARLHVTGDPAATINYVPDAIDATNGSWTNQAGGALAASDINNPSLSPATYALSIGANNLEVSCAASAPGVGATVTVHVYAKSDSAVTATDLNAFLYQASTIKATFSTTGSALPVSGAAFAHVVSYALTAPQIASITNWADLNLRFSRFAGINVRIEDCWIAVTGGAGGKTVIVQAATGQTETLTEWQNVAGTSLVTVTVAGRLTVESGGTMRFVPGATNTYVMTSDANGDITLAPSRITVRKNTGADVGHRARINFIEGANVTLTVADDGANDEIDVTIAASGGGAAHDLLDGSQNQDTLAAAVSRGSLIRGNSTPLWSEYVIGAAGKVLYSDGTDAAWSDTLAEELTFNKSLIHLGISHSQSTPTPARPSAGYTKLFADSGVGRVNMAQWREEGRMQWLQGNLGQCAVRLIRPGTGTAPTVTGTSIGTVSGTASHPTVANTNFSTSIRRTQVLSATGAGSTGAIFEANLGVWIGNAAGLGGFYHCSKGILGVSSSSLGHFGFWGFRNSTSAMGATTPGTGATDLCGIGADAGDANYSIYHNDNGGNATKTTLDGTGGMPTIAVGTPVMLEMRIDPNGTTMYFRVTRLDDTTVAPAIYNSNTNLPRNSVFLAFHMNGYTNADGTQPVTLSLYGSYTECDN